MKWNVDLTKNNAMEICKKLNFSSEEFFFLEKLNAVGSVTVGNFQTWS